MDKRQFLKSSGALLASTLLPRINEAQVTGKGLPQNPEQHPAARTNWAGNYTYTAQHLETPTSTEQVQELVTSRAHSKALGARHSFNNIADSPDTQISLKNLDGMKIDASARTVTVGAGVTYGHLAPYIDKAGFAVHNLASLPHISVVGACATATHGSGLRNGNLSTAVSGLKAVTHNGDVVTVTRAKDGDLFRGVVVNLGALGIVTEATLDLVPRFDVSQTVYENLSFDQLEHNLENIFSAGYSVSLFSDWKHGRATQVWIKRRIDPNHPLPKAAPDFYGATLQKTKLHPLGGHDPINCTEQMGIPGPWYERLPHFRMDFTPSSGQELQTEYFVPLEHGYAAIRAVEQIRDQITPHLFISEFRTIDADDLWISPCYKQRSMTIHFTWKPEWAAVKKILPEIEARLAPFNAKPHWAKLFTMDPARIRSLHPRMADFQNLVRQHDPQGKFRNQYLDTDIYTA